MTLYPTFDKTSDSVSFDSIALNLNKSNRMEQLKMRKWKKSIKENEKQKTKNKRRKSLPIDPTLISG